jgi:replicative DNA helicase
VTTPLPPYDLEAERAVLGAVLLEPDLAPLVVELPPEVFHAEKHRDVARAMAEVLRRGDPPDAMTIRAEMEAQKTYDPATTPGVLATCQEEATVATQLGTYLRRLRELAARRGFMRLCWQTHGRAADVGVSIWETIGGLVSECVRMEQGYAPDELLTGERYAQELLSPDESAPVPCGLPILDDLAGGLRCKNLTVLAARPGMGKTTLATQIFYSLAIEAGLPVAFLSLEMTRREIGVRLMAQAANVPLGRVEAMGRAQTAAEAIRRSGVLIADPPAPTLDQVLALLRRAVTQQQAVVAIVDHIGKIVGSNPRDRNQELREIASGLKTAARQLGIPILLLCQLNRQSERRESKRPQLSDLRDSGTIEEEAAAVLFIWAKSDADGHVPLQPVQLFLAKNRFGERGERGYVFDRPSGRFVPEVVP